MRRRRPKKDRGPQYLLPKIYNTIFIILLFFATYCGRTDLSYVPGLGTAIHSGRRLVINNVAFRSIVDAVFPNPDHLLSSDIFSKISSEQLHDIHNEAIQRRDSLLARFIQRCVGIKDGGSVPPEGKEWHGLRHHNRHQPLVSSNGGFPPDYTPYYSNVGGIPLKERMNFWMTRRSPIIVGATSNSDSDNSSSDSSNSNSKPKKKAKTDGSRNKSSDDKVVDLSSDDTSEELANEYGIPSGLVKHLGKLDKKEDRSELEESVVQGFQLLLSADDPDTLEGNFDNHREDVYDALESYKFGYLINMGDRLSKETLLLM